MGGALLEQLVWDEEGNPLATTFVDYLLPTSTEIPVIEYGHVETPAPGPGGYKGVGEGGAIGAPAAVINAVADAISPFGVNIPRLPVTPASVVALVVSRRAGCDQAVAGAVLPAARRPARLMPWLQVRRHTLTDTPPRLPSL